MFASSTDPEQSCCRVDDNDETAITLLMIAEVDALAEQASWTVDLTLAQRC